MTAARGRGKSAALGLAMSSAVAFGYSNIFVTAPSPENLKTMFEFVFKGFDALDYQVCYVIWSKSFLTIYTLSN
jgi:N-acetyltransferase 10